ncbi:MAG: ATP-binding cassette domain-containing protein [Patescibacteria group bacterium]|nr:ATP-binding cassette domain-containing protein [Patescibacteria group bacterium]
MKFISIQHACIHNLKDVSVKIPLNKLVAVVGPSGSGKTSLIYDVLYKASEGNKVDCSISKIPKTLAIGQKVTVPKNIKLSLGEYNLQLLDKTIKQLKKDNLLIVDESCAGLGIEESQVVLRKLKQLIKKGISVIAIEHSKEIITGADHIIEFGPKSGKYGGEITFEGSLNQFKKSKSITADYIFSDKASNIDYKREPSAKAKSMQKKSVTLQGINKNNFKNFTLKFPLGSLVCITGKTGSGKTTLLNTTYSSLYKGRDAWKIRDEFGTAKKIIGKENIRRSYMVEQTPIGDHPTSRPVTYLSIWDNIRDIYTNLPSAKKLRLKKSDFIVTKQILDGDGEFSSKILSVKFKGKNINDLLGSTIEESLDIFSDSALIKRKLGFLQEVGLGYLTLGQKSDSLSGGEAQRVRLAKVLSKKLSDRCIYILDTPTKGLHLSNLPTLITVLQKIIDKNNTVLVASNKTEVINNSDFVINL